MDLNKTFSAVQYASRKLLALNDEKINQILLAVADAAENRKDFILAENRKDLDRMDISNPKYDRLKLTACLLYTSPSPRDRQKSRMPSSA